MAADDTLKKIDERLTRLEAALSQVGGGVGPMVDPAAFFRPHVDPAAFFRPQVDPAAFFRPHVDPAAFFRPIADPAPWPVGGWGGWHWPVHGPIGDPAPTPFAARAAAAASLGRIGPIGDPPPIDVSRFSVAQLEASLHSIAAEQARLTSMETMIKQQLDKAKKQQG